MKLFKRHNYIEEQDNHEYWKDPRLDDDGNYDYLVEELPSDTAKWQWYYQKCDSCGRHHRLNFESTHCFYCWDGWDSMTYVECWRCMFRDKINSIKAKIKKSISHRIRYVKMLKQFKENGVPITKELKQTVFKIIYN